MHAIAELCLIPMGVGVSVSHYVAECQRIFERHGLEVEMHAWGTNLEGPWDDVFAAIRECHERVHEVGAPRISSTIKVGTRTDRTQRMSDKVASVAEKLDADR